ncbi:hypothetical protein FQZ97_942530 [compost metagenome]
MLWLTRSYPHAAGVPIHLARYHITNGTVLDAFDSFAVVGLVSSLKAHHHIQFLLFGNLRRGQYLPDTGNIHGHRFFHKYVLSLAYGFFKVNRPETRRSGQDNHISVCNSAFVAFKSYILPAVGYVDLLLKGLFQGRVGPVEVVLKSVTQGHDLQVKARSHGVKGGACATAPAANYGYPDGIASAGIYALKRQAVNQCGPG